MSGARIATVRFVCTDRGTHPSRELGVMTLSDDPELRESLLAMVGPPSEEGAMTEDLALRQYEYERLSSQGNRLTRRERKHGPDAHASELESRMYDEIHGDELSFRQTWRFRCPTCKRDVQLGREVMIRLMEGLARSGVSRCDVSLLPANMTSN